MAVAHAPTIDELLSDRRDELGLTRREVAAKAGAIERSLLNWELGHSLPQPRHYAGICSGYGISLEQLTAAVAKSLFRRGGA